MTEVPYTLVTAPADTRLAQLQEQYAQAKADADEANSRLKAITDALKVELTTVAPEQARIQLVGGEGRPALRLAYSESWRVDAKRLKAEQPVLYVQYAKKSGSWSLKAVQSGGEQ
jgi:hypothetical protein